MNFKNNKPIHLQIRDYYRDLILNNVLKKGDYLPSVREVALANRINPNTVQRAFSSLTEEGLILSITGKGNIVNYEPNVSKGDGLIKKIKELIDDGYSLEEIQNALERIKNDTN